MELSKKLAPKEFREILQAIIKSIEATKTEVKNIHYSFIVGTQKQERMDLIDPSLHISSSFPLLQVTHYEKMHYLFVIRFTPINPKRPINLLHQHELH